METSQEIKAPVEPKKYQKPSNWDILSYAVIGSLASLIFYFINFKTARLKFMIPFNTYVNYPQLKNYEDSVYRISEDYGENSNDIEYFKKDLRLYSQIFGFILSFIFVFLILYFSAKDKLSVFEIVGFSFISVLLSTIFFSKYFLKFTAKIFPPSQNPYPDFYDDEDGIDTVSMKALLFGVPVGVFLTVVLFLFLLFYTYNVIVNN